MSAIKLESKIRRELFLREPSASGHAVTMPRERSLRKNKRTGPTNEDDSSDDFQTCLALDTPHHKHSTPSPMRSSFLTKDLNISEPELTDESWMNSIMIDLVMSKFAKRYDGVTFMAVDFAALALGSMTEGDIDQVKHWTDILGKRLEYSRSIMKPIVFLYNAQNIHWNLIRILFVPSPQLQLFEPIGKPSNRRGAAAGLNFRSVPRPVVKWLDLCCPLLSGESWISVSVSAITKQQQFTAFDCGVACLLYAEKCGLHQSKEDIDGNTTQDNITAFRKKLQEYFHLTIPRHSERKS